MSYEEEQNQIKSELRLVELQIQFLDKYFESNPSEKEKRYRPYSGYQFQLRKILTEKYYDNDYYDYSDKYLEYKILQHQRVDLECKLKESKTQRTVSKTLDFMDGVVPRHVSGRIYEVKDGDGCAKFCLWFMLIDAIICFIVFLFIG